MEYTGRLKGVTGDWLTGKWNLTFEVDGKVTDTIGAIKDKELTITAKEYRKKRSLDANGMYWKLLGKLAEVTHISKPRCHNLLLRRYGQYEEVEGRMVPLRIPDTEKAENKALEAEEYHIKPTSQTIPTGSGARDRVYFLLRGSHSYDAKEFSMLLEGLISECKEVGIPTMTDEEFARLMETYKQRKL